MKISKVLAGIAIYSILVFGFMTGSGVFAAELGPKEELDLDLTPAGVSSENINLKTSPQHKDPDQTQTLPKKTLIETPDSAVEKGAPLQSQIIKAQPIKLEYNGPETPKTIELKRVIEVKEAPAAAPVVSEEVKVRPKKVSIFNKWFGIETGVEKMNIRRPGATNNSTSRISEGIYTLSDCIDVAIKNNLPLQISEKSVKLSQMRILEARRNMLPTATIVWSPYEGSVSERRYTGRKQYIEGQQPVFRGGELYYTLKQAEINLQITKSEFNKIKNELVLQVKKAYYMLAKSENNEVMQRELSSEVERIAQMVKEQHDANIASKLELLNVTSQVGQIKYQLASAEGDVDIAELMLKQAMNVDPGAKVSIKPVLDFKRISVNYETALSTAFVSRPEMIMNTLMVEYYMYGKRIALAKSLPKVDILGSWGLAKENYMPQDNAWMDTGWGVANNVNITPDEKIQQQWYAGVKASLPFWGSTAEYSFTREQWVPVVSAFQGTEATTNLYKFKILDNLAMYTDKQAGDIDFDKARQELIKTKQDVTLEVKEQCFNYQKALIQLDTAASKVKYQENDLNLMKMKREFDELQDSGVIESMIKLSQEKFGYVQALTECHMAIAGINKAVGIEDYYKDE